MILSGEVINTPVTIVNIAAWPPNACAMISL